MKNFLRTLKAYVINRELNFPRRSFLYFNVDRNYCYRIYADSAAELVTVLGEASFTSIGGSIEYFSQRSYDLEVGGLVSMQPGYIVRLKI